MKNEYIRAFVIGSSFIAFVPFFYVVSNFNPIDFNFNYKAYTFIAPVYLGLMNVLSLFFKNKFNLSDRKRYLLIGLISPTIVLFTILSLKLYNYTLKRWIVHSIKLYLIHFLIWNIIIYYLNKYV